MHELRLRSESVHPDYTECTNPRYQRFWPLRTLVEAILDPPQKKRTKSLYSPYRGRRRTNPRWNSLWAHLQTSRVIISLIVDPVGRRYTILTLVEFIQWRDIRGNVLKKSIFCRFRGWKELIFEIFLSLRRAILSSYSCFTRKTECVEWFWVRSDHYSRSLTLLDTRSTKSRSGVPHRYNPPG